MSGTVIFDIKPYLPFADSAPDASSGSYGPQTQTPLEVKIAPDVAEMFGEEQLKTLAEVLRYDPRPGYQTDESREYGFAYGGFDIRFKVEGNTLTVTRAVPVKEQ